METITKKFIPNERTRILYGAADKLDGDRLKDYGDPGECFKKISRILNMLGFTYQGAGLTSYDVALMMIVVKLVRASNKKNYEDSLIDLCGYASLANCLYEKDLFGEIIQSPLRGSSSFEEDSSSNA